MTKYRPKGEQEAKGDEVVQAEGADTKPAALAAKDEGGGAKEAKSGEAKSGEGKSGEAKDAKDARAEKPKKKKKRRKKSAEVP
jgi:hypothetical protein